MCQDLENDDMNVPKNQGKEVLDNEMKKYDWSKSIFMGVGKKWVYYKVPLVKTGKYKKVKLFYDRSKDWDFEHER